MLSWLKKKKSTNSHKAEMAAMVGLSPQTKAKQEIIILGMGCAKCNEMEINTKKAVAELKIEEEVKHITDLVEIVGHGVTSIPALVIDGRVLSIGNVLPVSEIKDLLRQHRVVSE